SAGTRRYTRPLQRAHAPGPLRWAARGLGRLGSLAMAQRRAAAQSATRRAARRSVGGGGGRTQRRGTSQSGRGAVCGVSDRLCPELGVALWGVTGFPVTPSRRACAGAATGGPAGRTCAVGAGGIDLAGARGAAPGAARCRLGARRDGAARGA